jgi:hypothetical protein
VKETTVVILMAITMMAVVTSGFIYDAHENEAQIDARLIAEVFASYDVAAVHGAKP